MIQYLELIQYSRIIMIILENHFNNSKTIIYGDSVSMQNGDILFKFKDLDLICQQFNVAEQKASIIEAFKQNQKEKDCFTINELVSAPATLQNLMVFSINNESHIFKLSQLPFHNTKKTIAWRSDLSDDLLIRLCHSSTILRSLIRHRSDLSENVRFHIEQMY